MTIRKPKRISTATPTREGAGVHLQRAFGHDDTPLFDPFLLLDDFRSATPADYQKGFPWHPHRGIETITYVLQGEVEHGDSLGNQGVIGGGDVQWMTAGSGIIHQEMPLGDAQGRMEGFQLWANLPAGEKMSAPRYRDIAAAQIPTVRLDNGIEIKVICGEIGAVRGPVTDVRIEPQYLDLRLPPQQTLHHPTPPDHCVFAYIYAGNGRFDPESDERYGNRTLLLFEAGEQLVISAADEELRFLLISGKPLGEPIAWGGPIVMNTQAELEHAFTEYHNGRFLKHN